MQDVDKDLNRYISAGAYDCVFVIYGMPYIPQRPLSGEGPNHTGWVSTVFCPDWNQPYSNGQAVVIREWLRSTGQLFYERTRKLTNVPNIDTPEKFGYKINCCGENNWFGFYKDYLNREIIYQGKDWGLGDPAWEMGSPRSFWYP
jgi:hypothetical protein